MRVTARQGRLWHRQDGERLDSRTSVAPYLTLFTFKLEDFTIIYTTSQRYLHLSLWLCIYSEHLDSRTSVATFMLYLTQFTLKLENLPNNLSVIHRSILVIISMHIIVRAKRTITDEIFSNLSLQS